MSDQVIRTQRLEIVDEHDRTRASLSTSDNGSVMLALADGSSNPRIIMKVDELGTPVIHVWNDRDKPCIAMAIKPDGAINIIVSDGDRQLGGAYVGLSVMPDGTAEVNLRNRDGSETVLTPGQTLSA